MKPTLYTAETIALTDLPDYLGRYRLKVVDVELWQERGLVVWTENDDNAENAWRHKTIDTQDKVC